MSYLNFFLDLSSVEPRHRDKSFKLSSDKTGSEGKADAEAWIQVSLGNFSHHSLFLRQFEKLLVYLMSLLLKPLPILFLSGSDPEVSLPLDLLH